MLRFETFKLHTSVVTYDEFREEKLELTPVRNIQVKVTHKESIDVETGFNGRVNNYNGYTLDKKIKVGDVLVKGDNKLKVVWVDPVPRLSTLILEVI